jgi:tripartite-type tricarboxylate transporter receptor subunit TctC
VNIMLAALRILTFGLLALCAASANHLAGELFASATGVKLQHIPYKGSGPAMADLIGGHIPMSFVPIPNSIGNVQGGKLRALAVTSPKRSALLPELPTVQESLSQDFDVALRYGLAAPAGTPRPIIDKLNKALNEVLGSADVKQRLTTEGAEALAGTPEAYGADIDKEETMWRKLVSGLGLKMQ